MENIKSIQYKINGISRLFFYRKTSIVNYFMIQYNKFLEKKLGGKMLEIEKKYLILQMPNLEGKEKVEQERYFIEQKEDRQVRIQRKNDMYELEIKSKIEQGKFQKEKTRITKSEFEKLKRQCEKGILRDSYCIQQNPNITIKVYHGLYEGLVRAEVEFSSIEECKNYKKPEWMGKEISDTKLGLDVRLIQMTREEFLQYMDKGRDINGY